jgi:hypothetical protein
LIIDLNAAHAKKMKDQETSFRQAINDLEALHLRKLQE